MEAERSDSTMTAYVYIYSGHSVYTVGFYSPDGEWNPESDHASSDAAAKRVRWLNGGNDNAQIP